MIELDLLLGHLVGDFIVQNDWMAKNKIAFGLNSKELVELWNRTVSIRVGDVSYPEGTTIYHNARADDYLKQYAITRRGHLACTIHCLFYTLSVWAFSWQ